MKTLNLVVAILTLIAASSLLICGLWMKSQPQVEPSSLAFHFKLGLATLCGTILTAILLLIANRQL